MKNIVCGDLKMKIISMSCPNCGASLQVNADKKKLTCNYCGNYFFLDDEVQHIQYDNAEEAGYQFERGRQRAQAEARNVNNRQQITISRPQKKNTWLWVLGWIFIFPVPLMILILRNKNLKTIFKFGIIAFVWIIYFVVVFVGTESNNNNTNSGKRNNDTSVVEETSVESSYIDIQETKKDDNKTQKTDSSTKEDAINSIVEKYNDSAKNKLVYKEDFIVSSRDSGHYRTEFRLGAYTDAIGKSYNFYDKKVDIVARQNYSSNIIIRLYSDGITLEQCIELIRYVSPLLAHNISDETVNEAIDYVKENKEANGYYYGELGLLVLGNDTKGYNLMIKTD